eukprot:CAMPEP_0177740598 /NCGR_PEP_ID=MMETSP0484_2-20121128/27656_1 /TAXON_ID=354590 /ORGANISM="Rhodomonas lens, Strain RHODO" /LENGTH=71 /DNA_ID=CAMNT_0019254761 /DNA_START=108 /DNA_END=318 /DNA_ORIENTATION=-
MRQSELGSAVGGADFGRVDCALGGVGCKSWRGVVDWVLLSGDVCWAAGGARCRGVGVMLTREAVDACVLLA